MKVAFETLMTLVRKLTSSSIFWYLVFAGAIYYAYKSLIKPKEETFRDTPLPNNGTGIPVGWKPDALADAFHDYFDAFLSNSTNLHLLYIQGNSLTNDQFVALIKTYNAKFAKLDGNVTLWSRVKGFKAIWFGSGSEDQSIFIQKMITNKQDY